MPKLTNVAASAWQHVLLFGPPKSGKTRVAGELAEHGYNLVWFDFESGYNTLRQLSTAAQERINIIPVPDSPQFPVGIETALKVVRNPGTNITDGAPKYHAICVEHGKVDCPLCKKDGKPTEQVNMYLSAPDTIYVFDSMTQIVNSYIAHIMKQKGEDYKFEWDDWGNLGKVMDRFLSFVQTMPAHVIVISHETEVEMEDGKLKLVATAGTRNFSRNSAKYFDHVVYSEVKNRKHIAASSTTYSNNILTGSRLNVSTESGEQPTLLDIFKGKVGTAQAPASLVKNLTAAVKKP